MNIKDLLEHIRMDMPVIVMILLVLFSAVAAIYIKHASRSEFVQLQQLVKQRDALNEEWGRLLLEESTWASPNRVEQQAKTKLNMQVPSSEMTVVIRP